MISDLTTLLAEADAVSAAATPGPWEAIAERGNENFSHSIYSEGYKGLLIARCNQNGSHDDDAAFIAASRDLIPRLVAACREQMAEIERLRDVVQTVRQEKDTELRRRMLASLLDLWRDGCFENTADEAAQAALDDQADGLDVAAIIEAWLNALQPAGKDTL